MNGAPTNGPGSGNGSGYGYGGGGAAYGYGISGTGYGGTGYGGTGYGGAGYGGAGYGGVPQQVQQGAPPGAAMLGQQGPLGSGSLGGAPAQPPKKKKSIVDIAILVLGVVVVFCVLFLLRGEAESDHIKPGCIVQATTTGNPSMITTAFYGLRGEDFMNLASQDQANLQACDVPGAVGVLHSSWASSGGIAWANPQDWQACTALRRFPFDEQSCSADTDCYLLRHLPCGADIKDGNGFSNWQPTNSQRPELFQCGNGTLSDGTYMTKCSFSDNSTNSGTCAFTDNPLNETNVQCLSGHCHYSATSQPTDGPSWSTGTACPFVVCESSYTTDGSTWAVGTGVPKQGDCYEGQICSYTDAIDGAGMAGYCMGQPLPHLMLNQPILVEGTVTAANKDGTFNVFWDHAQLLYDLQGPAQGWNYQACVVTPSTNAINSQARAILFGQGGSWSEGMTLSDPLGFTALAQNKVPKYTLEWQAAMGASPGDGHSYQQLDAIAPVNHAIVEPGSTSTAFSAWNLASNNVPKAVLMRVPSHEIVPTPKTDGVLASWSSQYSIASASYLPTLTEANSPYY